MKTEFAFQLNNQLLFGIGKTAEINDLLVSNNWANIALVIDSGVAEHSNYFRELKTLLENADLTISEIQLRGNEEPSYDYLDKIADEVRALSELDVIVGIGGGSALDMTKALAGLYTNPGLGINYRGFDNLSNRALPTICIPTTAGTGSEVTINAVFTDKSEMKKLGINGRYMNATYAILDAKWLESCPKSAAISAGMDALVHTLESFMTTNANPLTRAFNREAFVLLWKNLPALEDLPSDLNARQNLLLGAYLAAAGLFNSGSGIAGGLSYPLGVHYHVPHGIGGGIFIADVIKFNVDRGWYEYAELLDLIEPHPDWSEEQKAKKFSVLLFELASHLKVPQHLTQWGITEANVEEVARHMLPLQTAFNQNPVPFSADQDALRILRLHVEQL
jgi:alcohol dehydrogenase class IV